MPRPGYTQLAPTDLRRDQFERLARVLGLDPAQHFDRVKMLDFGMMCAGVVVTLLQEALKQESFLRERFPDSVIKVQSNDSADPT